MLLNGRPLATDLLSSTVDDFCKVDAADIAWAQENHGVCNVLDASGERELVLICHGRWPWGTDMALAGTTDRKWTSIKGQQGQWYATVKWVDGSQEVLPCVHQFHYRKDARGFFYHDDLEGLSMQDRRVLDHLDRIRSTGRVVLTTDEVDMTKVGDGRFTRTGYVAVYDVADLTVDDRGYGFRFIKRYNKVY